MLLIHDPELQTQLPRPAIQRDLIDSWLMASPEFEMDRAVGAHDQVLCRRDNLAAIESFHDYGLTDRRRGILDGDIDRLIMS